MAGEEGAIILKYEAKWRKMRVGVAIVRWGRGGGGRGTPILSLQNLTARKSIENNK